MYSYIIIYTRDVCSSLPKQKQSKTYNSSCLTSCSTGKSCFFLGIPLYRNVHQLCNLQKKTSQTDHFFAERTKKTLNKISAGKIKTTTSHVRLWRSGHLRFVLKHIHPVLITTFVRQQFVSEIGVIKYRKTLSTKIFKKYHVVTGFVSWFYNQFWLSLWKSVNPSHCPARMNHTGTPASCI